MLRSFRLVRGLLPDVGTLLQPSFAQQRKLTLPPGRYGAFGHRDSPKRDQNERTIT
jgi:hypothetical protein